MDDDHDLPEREVQTSGYVIVVQLVHIVYFQKMIPGAQCADLLLAPLFGPLTHLFWIGVRDAPPFLYVGDVRRCAVTHLYCS